MSSRASALSTRPYSRRARTSLAPSAAAPFFDVLNWNQAIYWFLLLPMMFFAAVGKFSVLDLSDNSKLASEYGSLQTTDSGPPIHKYLAFLVYIVVIFALIAFRKRLFQACAQNALMLALPILAIASTAWSQFPKVTVLYSGYIVLTTLFSIYIATRFTPERQIGLWLFNGTVALAASIAIVIVFPQAGVDAKGFLGAWQGIYPHKNIAALMTVLFLIPVFSFEAKTKWHRTFRLLYTIFSLFFIVMTTARTGWLQTGIVLMSLVGLKFLRKFSSRDRPIVIFALVPLIVTVVVGATILAPYLAVLMGKDPTLTGRTEIWKACIASAMKRPWLGYGFFAFWNGLQGEAANTAMAAADISLGNAENGVLQMWLEIGLVGVAILAVMLIRTCRNAAKVIFRKDAPAYVDWYFGVVVFTLLSLVDGAKFLMPHALYWMMYVVADVGLAAEVRRTKAIDAVDHQAALAESAARQRSRRRLRVAS